MWGEESEETEPEDTDEAEMWLERKVKEKWKGMKRGEKLREES